MVFEDTGWTEKEHDPVMTAWLPVHVREEAASDPQPSCPGCAGLIADRDWSDMPLDACEGWPLKLRATLAQLLRSPVPMLLLWGTQGSHSTMTPMQLSCAVSTLRF